MNLEESEPITDAAYDFLTDFDGDPALFWNRLSDYVRIRLTADSVCIVIFGGSQSAKVRVLAQSPDGAARRIARAGALAKSPQQMTSVFEPVPGVPGERFEALSLPGREGVPTIWVVAENSSDLDDGVVKDAVAKEIRLLADMYQIRRQSHRKDEKLLSLTEVLDLGLALGETTRFQEAALRLCNEVAAPAAASRVALAWIEGQDLKLKAASHGGRVSANSEEARSLQQVMEEATDQDNEVCFPDLPGATVINREHRQYSAAHEGAAVVSIPFRNAGQVCGALCLERGIDDGPWEEGEVDRMRLVADLVAPRLHDLHLKSGWFGRRWWRSIRKSSGNLIGHENTGWKLTGLLLATVLVALAVIRIEHKVRAPFILKTDAAAVIAAPFPGYIEEAPFHLGDVVSKGDLLVGLDRKELLLEEADTLALKNKKEREAQSHKAERKLAQMQVAQAEVKQADAKLAIIRHRLEQTRVTAPFDGIIVEGELRERLSSPVQAAETLVRLVQLKDLFGQLQVDDRDISYLKQGAEGALAFASRPEEKIAVKLDRFEPVAEVRPEGSVFLLRARLLDEPQPWWRPGMSGVCKIDSGKRSVLWIISHRIVETIRLWLWV